MTTIREQLIRFIDLLRERGVRISVAETIDAMNAVAAAGIERTAMREALGHAPGPTATAVYQPLNEDAARSAMEKVAEEMIGNGQKMIEAEKTVG
ncbi:MAG: hypothetical protein WA005_16995 [Candidatus Binataceae bacterium]